MTLMYYGRRMSQIKIYMSQNKHLTFAGLE